MSNLRLNGDDHPEAAAKLLNDSIALQTASRIDGAAYLAGYVVECSLKSLVRFELGDSTDVRRYKHDINSLSSNVLRFAALPSSKTVRYAPNIDRSNSIYDNNTGWKETLRYRAPGYVASNTANEWIEEAQRVYISTVAKMKLDGVI